ncbi:MAG: hypothetical protein K8R88_08490 [Armatimonadetes bacterium]|nr:hypothetical protein [Armatimonadota bacterium]
MTPGLLITGFGPFGEVADNPSGTLARTSGEEFLELEVSYQAVDRLIDSDTLASYQRILMLGVAMKATRCRLELYTHNEVHGLADALGETRTGSIMEGAPPILGSTLWLPKMTDKVPRNCEISIDPGRYLCNYLGYRVNQAYPNVRAGFLHVPPVEALSLEKQARIVRRIIAATDYI